MHFSVSHSKEARLTTHATGGKGCKQQKISGSPHASIQVNPHRKRGGGCKQAQKSIVFLLLTLILSVAEKKATYIMIPNLRSCPDLQVHMHAEGV